MLLSRDRLIGVSLEELDLPNKVLDPRLGIGMLAVYLATVRGYNQTGIVQSYSTMIRTVPYLNTVIPDNDILGVAEHKYALHSKIDPELLLIDKLSPELLCFHALRQRADVKLHRKEAICNERAAIIDKKNALERIALGAGIELPSDYDSFDVFGPSIKDGQLTYLLSGIVKSLGHTIESVKHRSYLDKTKRSQVISSYKTINALNPIISS